jgi:long-chain acyl-CoA synthetase
MPNLARFLQDRIRRQPDAAALYHDGDLRSYGHFGERIARLAAGLRGGLGLCAGDRVLLWMENRPEFLELLFACWHAGLVAVPANARLHPREIAHIAADSGAHCAFTSASLEPGLSQALGASDAPAPQCLVVGSRSWSRLADEAPIDCVEVRAEDAAWLFYTSGTTGRPKGATLTHRNLTFMSMAYLADIEHVAPGDTMLHAAPLSHGSGLYALPHLLGGGLQVVQHGFEPEAVLQALERWPRVSMFAAPTMVTRMLPSLAAGAGASGLRTLVYGGGPMYLSDLQRALQTLGPRLYHLYGQGESPMTITGLDAGGHLGDGSPGHLARLASCGRPRTGVEVRVVDEDGRALPAGEIGEVVTRSDCVMAGYWNNPAATATAVRDGWLWTGDVGWLDERGFLTLRDRSKDLIIRGGANIYPREVEEVLLRHPGVLECSVVGCPDADLGESVAAFVVTRPGLAVGEADLDALCLDHIARFKRPRLYRFVDALPKNHYGKVLKTELRGQLTGGGQRSR